MVLKPVIMVLVASALAPAVGIGIFLLMQAN
jgi:hypothetical protein